MCLSVMLSLLSSLFAWGLGSMSSRLLLCDRLDAIEHHWCIGRPIEHGHQLFAACAAGTYNALVNQSSSSACLGAPRAGGRASGRACVRPGGVGSAIRCDAMCCDAMCCDVLQCVRRAATLVLELRPVLVSAD